MYFDEDFENLSIHINYSLHINWFNRRAYKELPQNKRPE